MITIREDVAVRLEERVNKIWSAYGKKGSGIDNVQDYANHIITKHLNKKDQDDKDELNGGIGWIEFRRKHFTEIYKRDNGQCFYCKKLLKKNEVTLDHKLSPLRGGQNTLSNICVACSWCNSDKSMLTDEEYYYKQLTNASKGIYPPK